MSEYPQRSEDLFERRSNSFSAGSLQSTNQKAASASPFSFASCFGCEYDTDCLTSTEGCVMSSKPKTVFLQDYKKPAYLIPVTNLHFDLYDDASFVISRLEVVRNSEEGAEAGPLVLNGEDLELVSLKIDGNEVDDSHYSLNEEGLTIPGLGDRAILEIKVKLNPNLNKSLEGLYKSDHVFCTQCEPHGFRKITFFLDRPDVMSKYTTTITADKEKYPVLLSNGNPVGGGNLEGGRHFKRWNDPFLKPSYLFALVAGDLACVKDHFVTMSGRNIELFIYVDKGNENKCDHAMLSLKNAMKWDEETFGLECDLDIYMIVAVDAFNMGAMENKGLNIFNTQYVLADPTTATDQNYQGIEGVIAHEYFHNWTGNRVTCRDWFQITLKEGLTVFRDQEFSGDMTSRPVKRISDVRLLRDYQFAEDAGPNVHPIRPESYMEVNNFYTSTVYNKGAEIIRMIETLIGKDVFKKGITKYFELFDGQAVTTEDFIHAMHLVSGFDFTQFKRWYCQAGTPVCKATGAFDAGAQTYTLSIEQFPPVVLKKQEAKPFLFPFTVGLLNSNGKSFILRSEGDSSEVMGKEKVLIVSERKQDFVFKDIHSPPVPSLLRDFSAPIKLEFDYSDDDLSFLMSNDKNNFNRFEACQRLAKRCLLQMIKARQLNQEMEVSESFMNAFGKLLENADADPAFCAETMVLPSMSTMIDLLPEADFDSVFEAKQCLLKILAEKSQDILLKMYYAYQDKGSYRTDADSVGRRTLKNRVLEYLSILEEADIIQMVVQQFEKATNMTDEIAALSFLCQINCAERDLAIESFYQKWYHQPLVMNKWFVVQALSKREDALTCVKSLEKHKAFDIKNPNKVRSLIGAFAGNLPRFHAVSGEGYRYLANKIIEIDQFNPSISARLATAFKYFSKLDSERKKIMRNELEKMMTGRELSRDLFEIISNTLQSDQFQKAASA